MKMVFGIGNKKGAGSSSGSEKHSPSAEAQKDPFATTQYGGGAEAGIGEDGLTDPNDAGHSLHRGLSARQITMIAIGGG